MMSSDDFYAVPRWYAVYCKSGEEERVLEKLEALRPRFGDLIKEFYIPYYLKTTRGKLVKYHAYPCYIFANVIMDSKLWFAIRNTKDVFGFIGSSGKGAKPIPLYDDEVESLKKRYVLPEDCDFKEGDKVSILNEMFKDHEGTVSSIEEDGIMISVDMMGRVLDVKFDVGELIKKRSNASSS